MSFDTKAKERKFLIANLPTPMGGLALGIASLGSCLENLSIFNGEAELIGAIIASFLIFLLGLKFISYPKKLLSDLTHPVTGSLVPTFTMALMVISISLERFSSLAGEILWLLSVTLHLIFLGIFIYFRSIDFKMEHMVPSWYIPPIGLIVADVSFAGYENLQPIADLILDFGMICYSVMLPLMLYRIIFYSKIQNQQKPTIAILAAPASLSLAGYLSINSDPSPVLLALLFGIAILMTSLIYLSFIKLLKLPFSPGYSAFTFPMVISATALFKLGYFLEGTSADIKIIEQINILANIELLGATIIVFYVSGAYIKNFLPKDLFKESF